MPSVAGLQTVASELPKSKTVSVTRPNDASPYLANDVIGASTGATAAIEFTDIAKAGSEFMITGLDFRVNVAALISGEAAYRLQLYSATPPSALGDNAPWDIPSGDRSVYLGAIDISTPVDEGSTLCIKMREINAQVRLTGTSLFAYLVTVGPYTPTAQRVYEVTIHGLTL
jgi:hypothetical protein